MGIFDKHKVVAGQGGISLKRSEYTSFADMLEKKGFRKEAKELLSRLLAGRQPIRQVVSAGFNDPGKIEEYETAEIFVLVEEPSWGTFFYKVVESVDEGKQIEKDVLESSWAPIGMQVFTAQAMHASRKTFSS